MNLETCCCVNGGTSLTHVYNGLDDRVATTTGGTTRRYVYDADGRILGEYGASAADVKAEYLWLSATASNDNQSFGGDDGTGGYTPLAIATAPTGGSASLSWIHANHLGVPLTTTDATGTEIAAPSTATALGFPGQMKTLPDLWYNRHRDYDPTSGRYIQADPIGLEGDANPYSYAQNNPLMWIDPEGLSKSIVRTTPRAARNGRGSQYLPEPPPARPAPRYRSGETFIGPPGSIPTARQAAEARGQCPTSGETFWTQNGRRAHERYRLTLGGGYEFDQRLPSGRRPDATDYLNRVVRELKPDNPRAIREGNRQLEQYRQELQRERGGNWTSHLDLYTPPSR
jgi:RHS repeat-associated protein